MARDIASLPYRPCVGIALFNAQGRVFVARRRPDKGPEYRDPIYEWQMPQGGIDPGEDLHQAAYRELWEETGVEAGHVELIAQTRAPLLYDLPDELLGRVWGGKYRGQTQHWLLARFSGSDADIRIDHHDPAEFCEWQWVEPARLVDLIVPFKKHVYEAVLEEFSPLIES